MALYVPEVAPLSRRQIESEASGVLAEFYHRLLEEPGKFPVLDFFDHCLREVYGLDTGVKPLSDGVEGVTFPDGRVFVSEETYRRACRGDGRARFTVLHESYHGIRHRNQIRSRLVHFGGLVLRRRQSIPAFRDPEWQANVFAAAALMPAQMLRIVAQRAARPYLAREVSSTFGVSVQAAEVRISQLGL
jgi:IrrE N-terminal-like domain